MDHDTGRKHVQRAAYAAYQRLQQRLDRLPVAAAEYAALRAQTRLAEAYWRDLMDRPPVAVPPPDPAITLYREHVRAWSDAGARSLDLTLARAQAGLPEQGHAIVPA